MSEVDVIPELKQILGALLFGAKEPVSLEQMRLVFEQTAEQHGGVSKDFRHVSDELLSQTLEELDKGLIAAGAGFHVQEVAHGYRLVNNRNCGPWLRVLLEKGKAHRLSRPALETLAIIAYRQPVARSEIEAVRGVAVDQMVRNLLDLQLVRVVGRSDLPGRPWLFGTTQKFLEHFGIKSVNDLPGTGELRRLEEQQRKPRETAAAAPDEDDPEAETGAEPLAEAEANEAAPDEDEPDAEVGDESSAEAHEEEAAPDEDDSPDPKKEDGNPDESG